MLPQPPRNLGKEAIEAGQRAFRRELAAEAMESAKRLKKAYARTLRQLDAQLAQADGKDLRAMRSLRDQIQRSLDDLTGVITDEARRMESSGIRLGALRSADMLQAAGVRFATPNVAAIQSVIGYADSVAFRQAMGKYGSDFARLAADMIIGDASLGKNPLATIRRVRAFMKSMPLASAQRTVRTVQLYGARAGQREIFRANRNVVQGWRWSSALDKNTCPACLAQHGSIHSVDEIMQTHYLCRCAMVPITKSWSDLGFADGQDLQFQTGESWLREQPDSIQDAILGRAMGAAWRDGAFQLPEVVERFPSDVFGEMTRARSLRSIIGAARAAEYEMKAGKNNGRRDAQRSGGRTIPTAEQSFRSTRFQ